MQLFKVIKIVLTKIMFSYVSSYNSLSMHTQNVFDT